MLNNIYRCKICHLYAIAEEKDSHVCLEIKDTRIEYNARWIFDGNIWYPLKLDVKPTKTQQPDITPEEDTEQP